MKTFKVLLTSLALTTSAFAAGDAALLGLMEVCRPLTATEVTQCERLLEQGANANARGRSGYTAFHIAIQRGRHEVISNLIRFGGADVNEVALGRPNEPVLSYAIRRNFVEVARELVLSGANVTQTQIDSCRGNAAMLAALEEEGLPQKDAGKLQ